LMVGRLIAYKRHDIAIQAFNELRLPLKIIGRGPELERLKKLAGPTIEFLGRVPEEELPKHYAECRGFVFPQEEDFGIVAIEAMASGKPLIAYRGGDIVEHMEEGKMGEYFDVQTKESLIEAVKRFDENKYDPSYIQAKAQVFDKERFKATIKDYIDRAVAEHRTHS
jgi:glycosyltransferase involved in cell wall biosynthesis